MPPAPPSPDPRRAHSGNDIYGNCMPRGQDSEDSGKQEYFWPRTWAGDRCVVNALPLLGQLQDPGSRWSEGVASPALSFQFGDEGIILGSDVALVHRPRTAWRR